MAESNTTARRRRRKAAKVSPLPQKHCESCGNWMAGEDEHEDCVRCLGLDHAEDAFDRPERCSICADTPRGILARRRKRVREYFPREALDRDRERADIRAEQAVAAATANEAPANEAFDGRHSPPRRRPEPATWSQEMDDVAPLPDAQAEAPGGGAESMEEDDGEDGSSSDASASDRSSSSSARSASERRGGRYEAPAHQEQPAAILPPAVNAEGEVAAAPTAEPRAIAQAAQPLTKDDAPLMEVFKRAALRAGLAWPAEQAQDVEDETMWDEFGTEEEPSRAKQLLPLVKGFERILTASWRHPHSFSFPSGHKQSHDAAGMEKLGLEGMPHMHRRIAAHLLHQPVSHSNREPAFVNAVDKDNSKMNHVLYGSLATAAKALNALSLLQGSASSIFKAAGDEPSAENMAELRRIHSESLRLTKYITERTGRAMSCSVVLERARWVAYAPKTKERASILDETLHQDKLFSGTLDAHSMSARNEEEKKEGEALRAYLPTEHKLSYSSTYRSRDGRHSTRESRPQFKTPQVARAPSTSATRQRGPPPPPPPPPPPRSDSGSRRKPSASPAGQQRRGYKNKGPRGQGK